MPISVGNGVPVYYEVHGNGPPVLMITGMAGVLDWFHFNIPALAAAGFQVIPQDLRGSNRDGIPAAGGAYTTADMARDSVAILDDLGLGRVDVIGLSMGGMVAQQLALRHPERVRRVSLVANGLARIPAEIASAALDAMEHAAGQPPDPEADLRRALDLAFTPEFRTRSPERFAFYLDMHARHAPRPETLQAQIRASLAHDVLDELGSMAAPVQLLVGELDVANVGAAPDMAGRIPECRFELLPGMSHGLNLEHADQYNELVLDFLS